MSYIDRLDLRRVWIADPVNGLVFGLSMFRHTMTNKTYPVLNPDGTKRDQTMNFDPFDLAAAHVSRYGEQDSRHRSHGLHAAAALDERLERFSEIRGRKNGVGSHLTRTVARLLADCPR